MAPERKAFPFESNGGSVDVSMLFVAVEMRVSGVFDVVDKAQAVGDDGDGCCECAE